MKAADRVGMSGGLVFLVVAAAFTNIYVTQPVLPVLQNEFGASGAAVSLTVSAVVAGIALTNLPFGILADRIRIQPILIGGGAVVAVFGIVGALTAQLHVLIGARFLQGLALPAMMTCVAAYIGRTLPPQRVNVMMGTYVAATVAGGLGGRLLGGWLHPPTHWRYALASAACLVAVAALAAAWRLPDPGPSRQVTGTKTPVVEFLRTPSIARMYVVAFSGFFVFSSIFNYLPFRLRAAPLYLSIEATTALYLTYVVGLGIGPLAGALGNRIGHARTIVLGAMVTAVGTAVTLIDAWAVIALGLVLLCGGFFALHASAAGALNSRARAGRGRANALYVMFYYLGGFVGITVSGQVFQAWGWRGTVGVCLLVVAVTAWTGLRDRK